MANAQTKSEAGGKLISKTVLVNRATAPIAVTLQKMRFCGNTPRPVLMQRRSGLPGCRSNQTQGPARPSPSHVNKDRPEPPGRGSLLGRQ